MSDLRDAMMVQDETQRRGQAFLRVLPIMLIPFFVAVAMGVILRVMLPNVPDPEHVEPRRNPLVPILVTVIFFSALIALVRFGRPNLGHDRAAAIGENHAGAQRFSAETLCVAGKSG